MKNFNEQEFDDVFRNRFDNFESEAPSQVFDKIKNTLKTRNNANASTYLKVALLSTAILIASCVVYYFNVSSSKQEKNQNFAEIKTLVQPKPQQNKTENNAKVTEVNENKFVEIKNKTVSNSLAATFAGNDEKVCGLHFRLNAQKINEKSIAFWTSDNENVMFESKQFENPYEDPNAEISVPNEGTFKFFWNESKDNQKVSDEINILFTSIPKVNAGNDQIVCGLETELQSNGKFGFWSFNGKANFSDQKKSNTAITSPSVGKYNFVWNEIVGECLASDSVSVVFNALPNSGIKFSDNPKCAGDVVVFQPKSRSINDYQWNFDGGIIASKENDVVKVFWEKGQKHKVSLSVKDNNNCTSKSSVTIYEPERISANFSFLTDENEAPTVVYFNNKSSEENQSNSDNKPTTFFWNFGDNQTSTDENPEHIFTEAGNYSVKLIAKNESGCTDSMTSVVKIRSKNINRTSKTFTPNGDGNNDIFYVNAQGLNHFKCTILNKAGEKIFEWTNPDEGWDGTINKTNLALQGMYYFIIKGTDSESKPKEIAGTVYLVR